MQTPEAQSRHVIDSLLQHCGWAVQDRHDIDFSVALGIAVREFPLISGYADYMLFVNRQMVGVIEAKKAGIPLSGTGASSLELQCELAGRFSCTNTSITVSLPKHRHRNVLYESLDPDARSRRVFAFHQPEILYEWLDLGYKTVRANLLALPPLKNEHLWSAQSEAITNLEQSLALNKPRALIQMATGSGKTYTAVNYIYRLIRFGRVRRVLFLVDRSNLARQTLREFQQFTTPDDGRKFTELYNVQHLTSNTLDDVSKVCITTIQRLYSILRGDEDFDAEIEEQSLFEK